MGAKKQDGPRDISIADLIGLFAPQTAQKQAQPAPPAEEPSEPITAPAPPPKTQITVATPEELKAITELAEDAADLHDKIQELTGHLVAELGAKKKELLTKMLNHGLKKVEVAGRPAIELTIKSSKNLTKKSLVTVMGVAEANEVWNKLPVSTSEYITIPPKTNPEA